MANMNFVLVALFVLAGVNVIQSQNPYCNIKTCNPPSNNTLCKYTKSTWGSTCLSARAPVISAADKAKIVSLHNNYRRKVAKGLETGGNPGPQPAASNMRQLVWDDEIAQMAQTHAQQCVFKHDTCRDVSRFRVGQNIYMASSSVNVTTIDWAGATASWYSEVKNMKLPYVSNLPGDWAIFSTIGHYTQMVWANTYRVGCGVVSMKSASGWFSKLYVCNYGPTGNFVNSPIYTQGKAGSACPAGTTNKDGLCA